MFQTENKDDLESVIEHIDPPLRKDYRANWSSIKTGYYEGNHNHRYYNIRWETQTECDFSSFLEDIFKRQLHRFKINYSHSFFLQHIESKRYRFYHASNNTGRVFLKPKVINNYNDFKHFQNQVSSVDILSYVSHERPDTKWKVVMLTATTFFLDCMKEFTIGFAKNLPAFIRNYKYIFQLRKNHEGKLYSDNLCFFRCLSMAYGYTTYNNKIEKPAKLLARKWENMCLLRGLPREFGSVTLKDIDSLDIVSIISMFVFKKSFF